jgi:hypothetical protein
MTDLEIIEKYPFLLGEMRDCKKGDAHQRRIAELQALRAELPLSDGLRRLAEWNYYLSCPQGFHITRRDFERKYADHAPSYFGIG